MVLSDHPEALIRDEILVHVPEQFGLVVVGPDVKGLHAASLGQALQAEIVESSGWIFRSDLLDGITVSIDHEFSWRERPRPSSGVDTV
jgi:hypothetical protein